MPHPCLRGGGSREVQVAGSEMWAANGLSPALGPPVCVVLADGKVLRCSLSCSCWSAKTAQQKGTTAAGWSKNKVWENFFFFSSTTVKLAWGVLAGGHLTRRNNHFSSAPSVRNICRASSKWKPYGRSHFAYVNGKSQHTSLNRLEHFVPNRKSIKLKSKWSGIIQTQFFF